MTKRPASGSFGLTNEPRVTAIVLKEPTKRPGSRQLSSLYWVALRRPDTEKRFSLPAREREQGIILTNPKYFYIKIPCALSHR
jgi:hypothetical protein